MYRHGTGKQPQGKAPEFVRGNLSRRQEKGEEELRIWMIRKKEKKEIENKENINF